jgi:hypothetical protein
MRTQETFRVGICSDWAEWTGATLAKALAEVLEPLPGLEHEFMPDGPNRASPEILDRYDAVIAFTDPFARSSLTEVKRLSASRPSCRYGETLPFPIPGGRVRKRL